MTFPGVVTLDGSTIDTASPTLTVGRSGLTGTVTVLRVVLTRYGSVPGDALWPGVTFTAPTSTAAGRKMTCPSAICPVTAYPCAACQRPTAYPVSVSKCPLGTVNKPLA